jgi:glycosyltransferase involved in cell wall biosynthesis
MKIAYATTFDSHNVRNWSGTPFYMPKAFINNGVDIEYIGDLKEDRPAWFKASQLWKKFASGQRECPRFNIEVAKSYSKQVAQKLATLSVDAIVAPQINPVCYLDCKQPIVLWTDGLYASLIGFYHNFLDHSASTVRQGNIMTRECLSRSSLAIFSSDWAARSAIEIYGVDKSKVKVVPFGANIEHAPTFDQVKSFVQARGSKVIKLLFIGKRWERKGGSIVFEVAKALHAAGHAVELNFVGCTPPEGTQVPDYIRVHGFISKKTPEGVEKINRLLRESHFLFVPSRAEAFGIVFCEASAYGLPSLTTHVGGIPTVVRDNVNGMTFPLDAPINTYCDYIVHAMPHYQELALSSYHEFETRLNWRVATAQVKGLIESL